jgi:cytochrome c oxidase subunit 2
VTTRAVIDTAEDYQGLFDVYWAVGLGVMVVIWLAILVLAVRFRRRRGDETRPAQVHERPRLEAAYVGVLALVAAGLTFLTFTTMSAYTADLPAESTSDGGQTDADPSETPRAAVRIDVTAARWNWRFDYRGLGVTQVGDGRRIPTLVVPVGNVRFAATSRDVIHSFFIPYLRFKRDAFPERVTNFTLGFDRPGFHPAEGECAEFCGLRHAYMHFNVRVLEPGAFRDWVRARQDGRPQELTPELSEDGTWR